MNKLSNIIDKTGKWLSRIRTIAFFVLIVFLFLSIFKHGCDRDEIADLIQRTTGLNLENDILHNHIDERDSMLIKKEEVIDNLQAAIQRSEGKVNGMVTAYAKLNDKYDHLADSILTIPADSSYRFLDFQAYPSRGIRKFPFSGDQVQRIHLTWMERISLSDMNLNLKDRIHELNDQLLLKDSVAINSEQKMVLMQASTRDYQEIIINKDEIIEGQDDFIKKKKKQTKIGRFVAGAVIVILAILAGTG
jgi:hypothetical protein